METALKNNRTQENAQVYRSRLIAGLPVKERQIPTGKFSTTYLEGGNGTPLVLLHGPGESAVWWMRAIPQLVKNYQVVVPDLPGHGSSGMPEKKFSVQLGLEWLDEFLRQTCAEPPVLIGHVVGGAMAARFAVEQGDKLKQLILVDTLGLSNFRPAPRFAFEYLRFIINPSEKSFLRFLPHCMYDMDHLSHDLGERWQPFIDYNLACAQNPNNRSAAKGILGALNKKISDNDLKSINVPVTLIWGRHDKANKVQVASKASKKYSWPLHVIEDARDDPKLEQPMAFVKAVSLALKNHHRLAAGV